MSLFVDTSVWSLALRRDSESHAPEVNALKAALQSGHPVFTTGLVLQELLQGFSGPRDRSQIIDRFSALPIIAPDRQDHVEAAALGNVCRRAGIQIGTVDSILAQLCIRHALTMLTTDNDFSGIAKHTSLQLWKIGR